MKKKKWVSVLAVVMAGLMLLGTVSTALMILLS